MNNYYALSIRSVLVSIIVLLSLGTYSQIGSWEWVSGSNTINQSASFGTQGVAASSNIPGGRIVGNSWTDLDGNFWIFGGKGLMGNGNNGYLNDLWKYDKSTGLWTWMSGDNTANQYGSYGTQGIAAASNLPGARQVCISWADTNGNLWLYGGEGNAENNGGGYLNDVWKYNTLTGLWTWVSGFNTANQNGYFYGIQGVPDSANLPPIRFYGYSNADSDGNLLLYGGNGDSGYLNDLWRYDVSTELWTWISGSNNVNQAPNHGTQGVVASSNDPGGRYAGLSWIDISPL